MFLSKPAASPFLSTDRLADCLHVKPTLILTRCDGAVLLVCPTGTTLHPGPTQRAAEQDGQFGGRGLLDRQDQVSLLRHSE